jgi:Pectinacetylesterase
MKHRIFLLASLLASSLAACSGGTGTAPSGGTGEGGGSTQSGNGGATTGGTTGSSGGSGKAIEAATETWTWVPFADALCADGTATGIGVNLTDKSRRVLVFLQGGGGCWSDLTCYGLKTALHITGGYGEADFKEDQAMYLGTGFFDRQDPTNPFKDYSMVFVPYCTGDIHAGNNVVDYNGTKTYHVGFKNVQAYLSRLVPTFASAERVYLAGTSAGGFGAAINWWQTQQAFGKVRVDMINDSGTTLSPMYTNSTFAAEQRTNWNLDATLPSGCTECKTDPGSLLPYYGSVFADHRAALLSYTRDTVISKFNAISMDQFAVGLEEMLKARVDPLPSFHYFVYAGDGHVLWGHPDLATKNVTVKQWLTQMVTDDKAWTSEHP